MNQWLLTMALQMKHLAAQGSSGALSAEWKRHKKDRAAQKADTCDANSHTPCTGTRTTSPYVLEWNWMQQSCIYICVWTRAGFEEAEAFVSINWPRRWHFTTDCFFSNWLVPLTSFRFAFSAWTNGSWIKAASRINYRIEMPHWAAFCASAHTVFINATMHTCLTYTHTSAKPVCP